LKLRKVLRGNIPHYSHIICLVQRRQNVAVRRTNTDRSSKRPKSIVMAKSHLAASGSGSKLPAGPMIGPRPGPMLASADAAAESDVVVSSPIRAKRIATTNKVEKNITKNAMTEEKTSRSTLRPSYRALNTPLGL